MMETPVDPDPDPEFVFPCMRCAQRVVLTETLMTGSNLCCFSKDVPCDYCFVRKDGCLPVSHWLPDSSHCKTDGEQSSSRAAVSGSEYRESG